MNPRQREHASPEAAVGGASGTYTFLFTDVEESTRRWAEDRDAMSAARAHHDAVLREAIESRGGEIFKHTGDGVWAVFGSARAAADAALEAQRHLHVPVRMGLNTGEAEHRDGDWFGTTLNRTARIGDAGAGGQILCSSATAALLDDRDVRILGQFRLKGLEGAEVILQVGGGDFPPPRAVGIMAKVPERSAMLVGRDRLLVDLEHLLDTERLVTLVGPGGVGKTSVAIEAARIRNGRTDRIGFADLTTTDDPNRLLSTISSAFEMRVTTVDELAEALDRGGALLVLDNCEHLIDDVADLVERLIGAARSLTVLATSREVLEVAGERVVMVPPLDSADDLVTLFRARAAASGSELAAGDDDLVAELCRRLDGLPLAIELAAARLSVLSIEEMLDHLEDRLTLLVAGRRRGRDRHRTMQDTIAWSYELLEPDEQRAYTSLGVYVDWFDNDDAAAVTRQDRLPTVEVLQALAAKSLLVVDLSGRRLRKRSCTRRTRNRCGRCVGWRRRSSTRAGGRSKPTTSIWRCGW
jgi:predicted ATPase/class 3 adenylate cyclase